MLGAVDDLDLTPVIPFGLGGLVVAFIFRTLWRQDSGWQALIVAERQTAADARNDAAAAREEAQRARQTASEVAERSAKEVGHLRAEVAAAWTEVRRYERKTADQDKRINRLTAALENAGIAIPPADPPSR